jgi:hypothetical protein
VVFLGHPPRVDRSRCRTQAQCAARCGPHI